MMGKEIRVRGSVVRALCVKVGRENNEWERTVTSSIHCQDLQSNKGWVDVVSWHWWGRQNPNLRKATAEARALLVLTCATWSPSCGRSSAAFFIVLFLVVCLWFMTCHDHVPRSPGQYFSGPLRLPCGPWLLIWEEKGPHRDSKFC